MLNVIPRNAFGHCGGFSNRMTDGNVKCRLSDRVDFAQPILLAEIYQISNTELIP